MQKGITDDLGPNMLDGPAVAARQRFAGGSARHMAAMARFPSSRWLEVAPFQYLLPPRCSYLLDLFAGTGFASESLHGLFHEAFLLEPHVASSLKGSKNSRQLRACALSAESFIGLPRMDLAIGLAGFHHVLGPGPLEDRISHRQQRLEALRLWRSRLTSNGRLVIADVPAPGVDIGWRTGSFDGLASTPERGGSASSLSEGHAAFPRVTELCNLRD